MSRNIAIAIDDQYVQHACVMLQSLQSHNPQPIDVYCIYRELNQANRQVLENHFQSTNLRLVFILLGSIPDLPVKPGDHLTVTTFFRIWAPSLFKDLDEILFMDCDIIVDGDISYLFDLDVQGYPLAAAKEPAMTAEKKQRLGIPPDKDYFNAGVLKMNLAYFRTHGLTEKLLEFIRDFPGLCEFWDQDAFNAVIKGNYLRINYKYNMQTVLFDRRLLEHGSFTETLEKPVVIHFTGGGNCKPWLYANKHPLKYLYYGALGRTPFHDYLPPDMPAARKFMVRVHALFGPRRKSITFK